MKALGEFGVKAVAQLEGFRLEFAPSVGDQRQLGHQRQVAGRRQGQSLGEHCVVVVETEQVPQSLQRRLDSLTFAADALVRQRQQVPEILHVLAPAVQLGRRQRGACPAHPAASPAIGLLQPFLEQHPAVLAVAGQRRHVGQKRGQQPIDFVRRRLLLVRADGFLIERCHDAIEAQLDGTRCCGGKFARARRGDIGVAGAGELACDGRERPARRPGALAGFGLEHAQQRAHPFQVLADAVDARLARLAAGQFTPCRGQIVAGQAQQRRRDVLVLVHAMRHVESFCRRRIMHRPIHRSSRRRVVNVPLSRARSGRPRRCRRGRSSRRDSWRDTAGDSLRQNRTPAGRRSRS